MPELNWDTILAALAYAALTGVFNLVFARKSQIEAWAESEPRLAALLKLTRSVGFDPWNAISALSLFFAKKLPDVQKANSPIGRSEQAKADAKRLDPEATVRVTTLLVLLAAGLLGLSQRACATSPSHPACTPERHAQEETAYLARVNVACAAYDTPEACPDYPALKADFERTIDAGCGR